MPDGAGTVLAYREVAFDASGVDIARAVRIHADRSFDVFDTDVAGAVLLDADIAIDPGDVHVTRAVDRHLDIAAHIFHLEVAGAVPHAHAAGVLDGDVARAVADIGESRDSSDLHVAGAVLQ